jgi:hypothetical protein
MNGVSATGWIGVVVSVLLLGVGVDVDVDVDGSEATLIDDVDASTDGAVSSNVLAITIVVEVPALIILWHNAMQSIDWLKPTTPTTLGGAVTVEQRTLSMVRCVRWWMDHEREDATRRTMTFGNTTQILDQLLAFGFTKLFGLYLALLPTNKLHGLDRSATAIDLAYTAQHSTSAHHANQHRCKTPPNPNLLVACGWLPCWHADRT